MTQFTVCVICSGSQSKTVKTAIVAKEEDIPAVVGIGESLAEVQNGTIVAVNGYEGTVVIEVTGPTAQ